MQTLVQAEEQTREEFLPFALPSIGDEEIAEIVDTLRSGWVTTGPKVKRFEADFAAYTAASHALGVNSCTADCTPPSPRSELDQATRLSCPRLPSALPPTS
jgi:hypothetical protein